MKKQSFNKYYNLKKFETVGKNKRANHNDTKELIALNNAIKETHAINTPNKLQVLDTIKVSNMVNDFYHTLEQKELSKLFNGFYETIEDFITANYETITKGLIKSLACKYNVGFCIEIVNKGYYGDSLYFDLSQEIALYLLSHKDVITKNENNVFTISKDGFIECIKTIRNYANRNKTRLDNKEIALIEYDENNEQHISIAVNTQDYRNYCLEQANYMSNEQLEDFDEILRNVNFYIGINNCKKVSNNCKKMIRLLFDGYLKKDIAKILGVSKTTVTTYHDIIKSAFYNLYKKPYPKQDKTRQEDTTKHNYISIDFDNCFLYENITPTLNNYHFSVINTFNDIDNILEIVNEYHHNKEQLYYNFIFGIESIEDTNNTIDNVNEYHHNKTQKEYNNIFNNISFGYDINVK